MTESEDKKELIGKHIANNKYVLTQFISKGSFGSIYKVKERDGSRELAVKLEPMDTKIPQLSYEFRIYQILRHEYNHWSIPKTYFFGECYLHLALILDLLGPTLAQQFEECDESFGVKTVTLLAHQLIDIFEYIHCKRIIFRDVKPENFLLGLPQTPNENKLHIIDFGLAKEYKDSNGVHIPYIEGVGMNGTVRYMSINTHLRREQSRRDDMESIGYLLIYLLRGGLPWIGLNIHDYHQRFETIGQIKQKTKAETLCSDLPKEFCDYLKTVRSLDFTEEPNYKNLKEMFEKLLTERGEKMDYKYDWNDKKHKIKDKKNITKSVSNITLKETKT